MLYFAGRNTPEENCNTGDLRLANSQSPNSGRLEICFNRAWGTICRNSMNTQGYNVACKQLGYQPYGEFVLCQIQPIDNIKIIGRRLLLFKIKCFCWYWQWTYFCLRFSLHWDGKFNSGMWLKKYLFWRVFLRSFLWCDFGVHRLVL